MIIAACIATVLLTCQGAVGTIVTANSLQSTQFSPSKFGSNGRVGKPLYPSTLSRHPRVPFPIQASSGDANRGMRTSSSRLTALRKQSAEQLPDLPLAKRIPLSVVNNIIDQEGINSLDVAISQGQNTEFLNRLARRMIVKLPSEMVNAILLRAVQARDTTVIKLLLANGVSADVLEYPLRRAVRLGQKHMISYLTKELGVDPSLITAAESIVTSADDGQEMALSTASANGDYDSVALLLYQGVDLHFENEQPLRYAAKSDNLPIATLLLSHGADPNSNKGAPVKLAAVQGHYAMIKLLRRFGADLRVDDDFAFRIAAENGFYYLTRYLLLSTGADVAAADNYALKRAAYNGHKGVVILLLDNGADINADKSYALRWAAANGHGDVVDVLIEGGADVNALGGAALKYAAYFGHTAIVRRLVEAGADPNVDDEWPLRMAKTNGHHKAAQILSSSSSSADETIDSTDGEDQ